MNATYYVLCILYFTITNTKIRSYGLFVAYWKSCNITRLFLMMQYITVCTVQNMKPLHINNLKLGRHSVHTSPFLHKVKVYLMKATYLVSGGNEKENNTGHLHLLCKQVSYK